jgi:hypothetical protein
MARSPESTQTGSSTQLKLGAKKRSFTRRSSDHLVCLSEQQLWHAEAERLGGLQVDDQLALGRLLD